MNAIRSSSRRRLWTVFLPYLNGVEVFLALVRAGLLAFEWDESAGQFVVDWTRTKVFPYSEPTCLWVKL